MSGKLTKQWVWDSAWATFEVPTKYLKRWWDRQCSQEAWILLCIQRHRSLCCIRRQSSSDIRGSCCPIRALGCVGVTSRTILFRLHFLQFWRLPYTHLNLLGFWLLNGALLQGWKEQCYTWLSSPLTLSSIKCKMLRAKRWKLLSTWVPELSGLDCFQLKWPYFSSFQSLSWVSQC